MSFKRFKVGRIVTLEEGILLLVGGPFESHRLGLHRRGTCVQDPQNHVKRQNQEFRLLNGWVAGILAEFAFNVKNVGFRYPRMVPSAVNVLCYSGDF